MRILMVAPQPFFRPRGTPFSVLHRIRALLRLGHTVDLVTYPFGQSPVLNGLVIHRAARPAIVRDVAIGPSLNKILLDAPLVALAHRLAAGGGYGLVHTHEEAGFFGASLARKLGVPHLYDMHSSLPQQFENFGRFNWRPVVAMFRRLEQFTLNGADGVIAICPALRDHVRESGYSGPLALIENTLDFDPPPITEASISALRQHLGVGNAPTIVYTGTLEAYQGLDLLVDAAGIVVAQRPKTRFVIVGGTADQVVRLQQTVSERGMAGQFVLVPAVAPTDVFLYHRAATVLVTTRARGTNTPLKVYQYLRAGKPIVATAIESHTQVFDHTSAELVAPTPNDIAGGMLRVLADPARAAALAEGARVLAKDSYSEEAYMARLRDLLDQIAQRTPRARVAA